MITIKYEDIEEFLKQCEQLEAEYKQLQTENKRLKEEIDEAITLIDEGDEGTAREVLFQALQEKP